MKTIHPAIAEHVMEENERLRGLLRDCLDLAAMPSITRRLIDAALSQQAAPQSEESRMAEALGAFVSLAEDRLHELGALSPEMAECLTNGRAALSAQEK